MNDKKSKMDIKTTLNLVGNIYQIDNQTLLLMKLNFDNFCPYPTMNQLSLRYLQLELLF